MLRLAIVSDIHGNLTALEAVLADLRQTSPDVILHGGDLANGGASPAAVVDAIRDLGWPGVLGNVDEMLFAPQTLEEFARHSTAPSSLWDAVRETATWTIEQLGAARIAWLRELPRMQIRDDLALLHALPGTTWSAPAPEAGDAEMESAYASLGKPMVVYGHIHVPFVRKISEKLVVANTGGASLSYDGDCRASYLLLDGSKDGPTPRIRRVEYDVERESKALAACGLPHADWIRRMLASARPQMP
jgi:predicted phosphodiesterase